jgi:hypothetical protein
MVVVGSKVDDMLGVESGGCVVEKCKYPTMRGESGGDMITMCLKVLITPATIIV